MEYILLGNSYQIRELNDTIKQVAPANVSVLITGESGTGKELVANALHYYSKRKNRPLIKVNCGAIPEGIIESELFGHKKGAFTGAIETRQGYFELADKGTIFLDEIGEMPPTTQVKILRVIETGEFMKVGGEKYIKVDVRIIAATNRDLSKEVQNKNFREDLYFRLKSINLNIPPLRERKEDIIILFEHFVNVFCEENNIKFHGIEPEAIEFIRNYVWKGNARELKNFSESLIVLNPDKVITTDEVKRQLKPETTLNTQLQVLQNQPSEQLKIDLLMRGLYEIKNDLLDIKKLLYNTNIYDNNYPAENEDFIITKETMMKMSAEEIDREILKYLLRKNNWNINKTSLSLNQSPRNIYRKIKLYNLKKDET